MTQEMRWVVDGLPASVTGDHRNETALHTLDSGRDGPVVLVLAGVHGDEIGGIVAASRLARTDLRLRRGSVVVVPITHRSAFEASRRESPIDGGNLAREFPGSAQGTATQTLARALTDGVLSRCDVLIDLHTSSPHTDMPFFVGCLDDGGRVGRCSVALAKTFGAPLVWTHPSLGPGRTLGVAASRGIPAIYVESPHGGVLDEAVLRAYESGVVNVLRALDMVPAIPSIPATDAGQVCVHGDGDVDMFAAASRDGFFVRNVRLLDDVRCGDCVGWMVDANGQRLEEVAAPGDGRVVTLRRHALTTAGTPLVGVAPTRPWPPDPGELCPTWIARDRWAESPSKTPTK